jgi:hypothetical protein
MLNSWGHGLSLSPRYISVMSPLAPLHRLGVLVSRWFGPAEARLVLPLFLIALLGPLGEMADVALFSELELELLASDLGLEAVASVLVYGYQVVLMLLGLVAVALAMTISRDGPVLVPALASCRAGRPIKIPKV